MDVAATLAVQPRRALAAQALDRVVLRTRRDADLLRPAQRGDLDRRAADGLDDRDRDLDLEVIALALEDRRLGDVGDDVQVARLAGAHARLALAGQADATAVADARWDVHAVALDLARLARAVAGRARVLDLGAGAAALRARLRDREEVAAALGDDAATLAARADGRARARLGAGPVAGRAGRRHGNGDRDLAALHRLLEGQADLGLEVAPALGLRTRLAASPHGPAEQVGQDVAEAAEAAAELAGVEALAAGEDDAALVVLLALVGIADYVVGGLDLLEALLGGVVVRVAVGVVLARELAVGLLDVLLRGLLVYAECLVGVLHSATTTLAGRSTTSPAL